jgi:hypothetical protein
MKTNTFFRSADIYIAWLVIIQRNILHLCLLLLFCITYPSQAQAQKALTFDPEKDTIATTNQRGLWKISVPEALLIAAAQVVTPNLSSVHDVRIQDIHNKPYLFFRGSHREKPDVGYTVMVLLEESALGIWKAGSVYQACWGDTCNTCGFDDYWGCSCERYVGLSDESTESYCNHMIALGIGLARVEAP